MAAEEFVGEVASATLSPTGAPPVNWHQRVMFLICLALGVIFLYAGIAKVQTPYDFLSSIYSHQLFTSQQGLIVGMTIPALEIVTGIALLSRTCLKGRLLISVVLSTSFVFVHIRAVQEGIEVNCNCFGAQALLPAAVVDWKSVAVALVQDAAAVVALVICIKDNRKT